MNTLDEGVYDNTPSPMSLYGDEDPYDQGVEIDE